MFYDLALGLSWKMSHMHLIRKVHSAAIGLSSWLIDLFSFQHFKYVIPLLSFFFFFLRSQLFLITLLFSVH